MENIKKKEFILGNQTIKVFFKEWKISVNYLDV